jgi:hypothetical protein
MVAEIGGVDFGIEDNEGKSEASFATVAGAVFSIAAVCSVVLAESHAINPKN